MPADGNGDLQTLIWVPVARPRLFSTLSNPVPWQNWMAAYLGYSLQMKKLFHGWSIMVYDTHTRRRRLTQCFTNGLRVLFIGKRLSFLCHWSFELCSAQCCWLFSISTYSTSFSVFTYSYIIGGDDCAVPKYLITSFTILSNFFKNVYSNYIKKTSFPQNDWKQSLPITRC